MRYALLTLLLYGFVSSYSQAALFPTPISNASFENGSNGPGWLGQIDDWYESANGGLADGLDGAGVYPAPPDGSKWMTMAQDGWIYQAIGTWEENWTLKFDFIVADPTHRPFEGFTFQLWAGGGTTDNPNDLVDDPSINSIGAILLDSVSTGDLFPDPETGGSLAASVSLNTGDSTAFPGLTAGTHTLWVRINGEGSGSGADTGTQGMDKLSVIVTEIPEPASLVPLCVGGLLILSRSKPNA